MTAPRGQAPLARNAANGHQVPAPRRSARTSAQAPAPIRAKASAGAGEPAAPKPGPPAILGVSEATGALRFLGRLALRHPRAVLRTAPGLGQELLRISRGRSQVAPLEATGASLTRPGSRTPCSRRPCRATSPGARGWIAISTTSA